MLGPRRILLDHHQHSAIQPVREAAGMGHSMTILMGPVVAFQGCDDKTWRISVLVVADEEPEHMLLQQGAPDNSPPEPLWTVNGKTAYRYPVAIPRTEEGFVVTYRIGSIAHEIAIPAVEADPRMAY